MRNIFARNFSRGARAKKFGAKNTSPRDADE
jgi:hypothetical protein